MKTLIVSAMMVMASFAFAAEEAPTNPPAEQPNPPAEQPAKPEQPAPPAKPEQPVAPAKEILSFTCKCTGEACKSTADVSLKFNTTTLRVDVDGDKASLSAYAMKIVNKEKHMTYLKLPVRGSKALVLDADNNIKSMKMHGKSLDCVAN